MVSRNLFRWQFLLRNEFRETSKWSDLEINVKILRVHSELIDKYHLCQRSILTYSKRKVSAGLASAALIV